MESRVPGKTVRAAQEPPREGYRTATPGDAPSGVKMAHVRRGATMIMAREWTRKGWMRAAVTS